MHLPWSLHLCLFFPYTRSPADIFIKQYGFEPALPDALEREERKAKMDKVHKQFIPDPYKLGVHVSIDTNSTLRSGDEIAGELKKVSAQCQPSVLNPNSYPWARQA